MSSVSLVAVLPVFSLGALLAYTRLVFANNHRHLSTLGEAIRLKEIMVAVYLAFGFDLVTAGVYFAPYAPAPFESGLDATIFAASWSIMIFLATISYGFFKERHPEIYLLGLLIFNGTLALIYYPTKHIDYGSQFLHGLIGVGLLAILSVDCLATGRYVRRFLWGFSHIVLFGFALWFLAIGIGAYFRVEIHPAKSLFYSGFLLLGATWLYFEGLLACGRRYRPAKPVDPAVYREDPPPQRVETVSDPPTEQVADARAEVVSVPILSVETPVVLSPLPVAMESTSVVEVEDAIPLLRVCCLGPFRLFRGDEPIDGRMVQANQKPLAILKVLATSSKQKISQQELMDLLWEESEGDRARVACQKALSRLRAVLGCTGWLGGKSCYVIYTGKSYALNPDYTWVDVDEFMSLARLGQRCAQDGAEDRALTAFQAADDLWQGTLLEGHAPEPWLIPLRKRLEETYTHLHVTAGKLLIRRGAPDRAENCLRKGLAATPDSEEAIRLIALAQYAGGKKIEALKNLDDFARRLKETFDTEPSQRTCKLRRLLRTDQKINPVEWI